VQHRGDGAVPVAAPLAAFERAWVLAAIAGAGLTVTAPHGLVRSLHAALGMHGAAGGPGLPPDADDTATILFALARSGSPRSPECLRIYQQGNHFACFPSERTPSTSTNAHVLQAFGACHTPAPSGLSDWLCDLQEADGSWSDKWHASPYYATRCCAVALADHGRQTAEATVRAAVDWVLDTQHEDGSWGRWDGTYEETAYAVQILLQAGTSNADGRIERAAARGCAVLLSNAAEQEHPPLWHDKDLYTPLRIVRAEGLAALHLARTNPGVAALIVDAERPCSAGNQA
jgi:hypothetical protein